MQTFQNFKLIDFTAVVLLHASTVVHTSYLSWKLNFK